MSIQTDHSSGFNEGLLAPYDHICQLQGKNIRARFVAAFNAWLNLSVETTDKINAIVAMLHNASLLIDDIEDGATLRRGQPAAHTIFGTALTLNCGNFVYFAALSDTMNLVPDSTQLTPRASGSKGRSAAELAARIELVDAYSHELQQLHIGQGLDILWRDTFTVPTLEQYEAMVLQKTGGLFRLALKLMLAMRRYQDAARTPEPESPDASGSSSPKKQFTLNEAMEGKLIALVNTFSFLFQVLDDYLNLKSAAYHKNKSYCEDLTEGKFSYCITHSIIAARAKGDSRLFHAVRQKPRSDEMKDFCITLMEGTETFAHCRSKIEELRDNILMQIREIAPNSLLEQCLSGLLEALN